MNRESLIRKWLNNELNPTEAKAFESLEDYDFHQKIMATAQLFKASNIEEPATIDAFYERYNTFNAKEKKRSISFSFLMKIAASVALIFGISWYVWTTSDTAIHTLAKNKTSISLPDNSKVGLNADSKLVFNKKNWASNRKVQLEGEAFFEVAKGATFDVITDLGKVQVLGTKFNVKVRSNYFEVQCFEGLVRVSVDGKEKKLSAGETFRKINNEVITARTEERKPEWTRNISTFKSVPFAMVINEFERQYDVSISLKNIDQNRLFTGGFAHDNLNDGLKAITLPFDISYQIDGSNHIKFFKKASKQ